MARHYSTFSGAGAVPRTRPAPARKKEGDRASLRAAQYVRMSTEHQKYSTQNQSDTNRAYATLRGMKIVRTYADDGKSGVSIERRDALQRLIADVESGRADFNIILVYDVSRWGRFPDPDEAAYYEYICKRAKIRIHYCAEEFENDGSLFSVVAKSLKRVMAGEYSRELSVKVFAGQARLVRLGCSMGAAPGYGLRRMLVDENGVPKFLLAAGQLKSILTDRIVLVPGPPEELRVLHWMFEAAARRGKSEYDISHSLNRRKIAGVNGKRWTSQRVYRVLTNEKYIGTLVWNRESIKLNKDRVFNDPKDWIRVEAAIEPVIGRSLFKATQVALKERHRRPSRDERLAPLRRLFRAHGYLDRKLIDATPGVPCAVTYARWFGGLRGVYKLVGFTKHRPYRRRSRPPRSCAADTRKLSKDQMLELLREVLHKNGRLTRKIVDEASGIPCARKYCKTFGSMERAYQLAGYLSDEHFLDLLRALARRSGYLSRRLIDATPGMPHSETYVRRFGGMSRVYALIGYVPADHSNPRRKQRPRTCREFTVRDMLAAMRQLWRRHGRLTTGIIVKSQTGPCYTTLLKRFGSLRRVYKLIGYRPERRPSIRSSPRHWRRTADGGMFV